MLNKTYKNILVIGNGESRLQVNLNSINCVKIGCNAIHRDYVVDYLVAVDQRCVDEALKSKNCTETNIVTRADWLLNYSDPRIKEVPNIPYDGNDRPDEPRHWGSGPYAILLAAMLSNTVKIVGFDLWGINQNINNVYKGTDNYNDIDSYAVDPSYWIYQISKIFQHYPDKYFIVYNVKDWIVPEPWRLANVIIRTLDTISEE